MANWEQEYKAQIAPFQEQLATVRTWEDFQTLLAAMKGTGHTIVTKRRGQGCYAFIFDYGKVDYIMDDGRGRGRCRPENLYKYLTIR